VSPRRVSVESNCPALHALGRALLSAKTAGQARPAGSNISGKPAANRVCSLLASRRDQAFAIGERRAASRVE
jgi:hypothetical protein